MGPWKPKSGEKRVRGRDYTAIGVSDAVPTSASNGGAGGAAGSGGVVGRGVGEGALSTATEEAAAGKEATATAVEAAVAGAASAAAAEGLQVEEGGALSAKEKYVKGLAGLGITLSTKAGAVETLNPKPQT